MPPVIKAPVKRKYRLLRGRHVDRQGPPEEVLVNGETITRPSLRVFQADRRNGKFPEFESPHDLTGPAYNPRGFPPRFQLVGSTEQRQPTNPLERIQGESAAAHLARVQKLIEDAKSHIASATKSLDSMDAGELIEYAEDNEVDLTGVDDEDVEALRQAVKQAVGV